jgi:alpha-D-ribose 1-methylphosphonate 5-triphosphate diphosphatase PhnM
MAKSFFNSIKSAFVTEVPDENLVVETKQSVDEKVSQTKQPVFVVPSSTQKTIEGQVNDELLQKLCQAMEDSNLPGPDYLELKNVANNDDMKRAMPDEIQRLTVAFITMKSSNPEMTKERVITSIDEYINMMENERKVGHEQLEVIWNEKVESRKQVVANAEQRIAQIQAELKELVTFVQNENNEIASAVNECNINKANFDTTVDFLVNNLISDKNKLYNALN